MDCFAEVKAVLPCIAFLLEALKDDKESESHLQTQLLELIFAWSPKLADAILGKRMFNHYDRTIIYKLCEKEGYIQHAMEAIADPVNIF